MLVGWTMETCTDGLQDGEAGIRVSAQCAVLATLKSGAVDGECMTKKSALIRMVPGDLSALLANPVQCPARHALTGFSLVADSRAWYIRKDNPGMFSMEVTCCPSVGLEVCETVASGCGHITQKNAISKLIKVSDAADMEGGDPPVCDYDGSREVMTGWAVTSKGCEDAGRGKAVQVDIRLTLG